MDNVSVEVILVLIAAVLAVIELFQTNGRSFVAWAVLCLAAAHVLT